MSTLFEKGTLGPLSISFSVSSALTACPLHVFRDPDGPTGEETEQGDQQQAEPGPLATPLHSGQQPIPSRVQEALPAPELGQPHQRGPQPHHQGGQQKGTCQVCRDSRHCWG